MKLFITALTALILSTGAIANESDTLTSTITNRKTGDQLEVRCSDEQCSSIEFTLIEDKTSNVIAHFEKTEYLKKIENIIEQDRVKPKDHFMIITQGIAQLPWDNSEFRFAYFFTGLISIPLTAALVGIDVAVLPISTVSITGDLVDGNVGRKVERKIRRNKDTKLSERKFNILVDGISNL